MPRALLNLIALQSRAAVRHVLRGMRTVRGALLAALGLTMFLLWLLPTVLATFYAPQADPQRVKDVAPLALLALTAAAVVSGGERAILFTPAEVNLLFAGPFTRRQLLGYKLARSAIGSVVAALAVSVALRRLSPFWPAAFTGALLGLLFINLCTTCAGLLRQTAAVRLYTPLRLVATYGVLLVFAAGCALALAHGERFIESAAAFSHAPGGRVLLAPFIPFVRAFVAGKLFPDLLAWGGAAASIDLALFALVMRLDANYLEAAAAAGERAYEQARRVRQGDWLPGLRLNRAAGVPPLPWLGGAGPVAWRQLTALLRRSPKLVLVLGLCVLTFGPILFLAQRLPNLKTALIPAVGYATMLLLGALRFDFRGDLEQMAWLKALPVRPLPLAAGQVAVPTAALAVFHLVALGAIAAAVEPLRRPALVAMLLAVPGDLLLVAVENLAFLLFPHRPAPPGELGALGRQILLLMLKLVAVGVAAGVASLLAALAFWVTRSTSAAVSVAVVAVAVQGLALIPCAAGAYRQFDPSAHTPPA